MSGFLDWLGYVAAWAIVAIMIVAAGRWGAKIEPNDHRVINGCAAVVIAFCCAWAIWRVGQGL